MQERKVCSQAITAFLWLTSTKFGWRGSKRKCRSHKIDNCYKLWLRESVMHPFRPSSIPALFFRERILKVCTCYLYRLYFLHQFFFLLWSVVKFFDIPAFSLILATWLLPWFIVQSMHQSAHLSAKKSEKINQSING